MVFNSYWLFLYSLHYINFTILLFLLNYSDEGKAPKTVKILHMLKFPSYSLQTYHFGFFHKQLGFSNLIFCQIQIACLHDNFTSLDLFISTMSDCHLVKHSISVKKSTFLNILASGLSVKFLTYKYVDSVWPSSKIVIIQLSDIMSIFTKRR